MNCGRSTGDREGDEGHCFKAAVKPPGTVPSHESLPFSGIDRVIASRIASSPERNRGVDKDSPVRFTRRNAIALNNKAIVQ